MVDVADNDVPGVIAFGAAAYTATEGDAAATVMVRLSAAPGIALVVPVALTNGGAAGDSDWSAGGLQGEPGAYTLAFAGGETSKTFTVTAVDDTIVESAPETLVLSFGTLPESITAGTPAAATLTLVDDDVPVLTIVAVADTITEGAAAQFRVTSSLALAQPLTVSVLVEDSGTFLTGPAPTTVTVPAGNAGVFAVLDVPTENDATDEDDGTLTATLQTDAAYTRSVAVFMAMVEVADNDVPGGVAVAFSAATYEATEGGTAATVTVILSPASASAVSIPITLGNAVDDTAETADWSVTGLQGTPGDYTLAFAENETSKTFTVTAVDDNFAESATETLSLSFGTPLPDRVSLGTPAAATLTLVDDDVTELTIMAVAATITEGAVAQFRVTSSLALAQPLTVSVQVDDSGMFLAGAAPITVTVPDGDAGVSAVLDVPTENDATAEDDGTVTVTLQADAAYTISDTAGMAVVNVDDDDVLGVTVAFSAAAYTATEEGAAAMVIVNLNVAPGRALVVPVNLVNAGAAGDSDWSVADLQGAPGAYTLAFAENDTSKTFIVTAFDDAIDESALETLALSFGALPDRVSPGTPAAATLTLVDDDVPTLTITVGAATITEGAVARFRVTSDLALDQPLAVSVQVVDSGTFLTAPAPNTVVVPAGMNAGVSVDLVLPTEDDATDELNGTLTATLQANAAYMISGTGVAVVNVADDDDPEVTVAFSAAAYTATEGGADATVTVSLSDIPERSVEVPVNLVNAGAAADSDWSVADLQGTPGDYTLAFAESETSKTFTVTAVDDTIDEIASETLSLSFGTLPERVSLGTLATATLTLEDDDPTPTEISLSANLTTLTEGSGSKDIVVTATLEGSVTLPNELVIPLTLGGAATQGTDYAVTGERSISIAIGATTGMTTLTITPMVDDDTEETEAIDIMGTLADYTVNAVELTLQDQAGYTVSVPATAEVVEDGVTVIVAVTVTGERAARGPVTVPYTLTGDTATAGEDYMVPGTLALEFTTDELSDGTESKNISIGITDDTVYEGDEAFTVALGRPHGCNR